MSWLGENADELAALGLVFSGIYMCIVDKVDVGFALISIGTSYLFYKHPPREGFMPIKRNGGAVVG